MAGLASQKETKPSSMQQLFGLVSARLEGMGLTASLWDPSGAPLARPAQSGEFCCQMCGEWKACAEAMGRRVQQACLDGDSQIATTPSNCCMIVVPLHERRRAVGAVVACWPTHQTPDGEEFARACTQASVDSELMATLCKRVARHNADQAHSLCVMTESIIQDERAKQVACEELHTLSTNLASTYEELSLLYRISGSMKVTQSTTEFLENICRELREVMNLTSAVAVLHPREHSGKSEQIVVAGTLPVSDEQLSQIASRYLEPRLGASDRPIIENQFDEQAGHLGQAARKIHTLIATPLMSTDHCKGMLLGINKVGGDFDSIDLKLISSISSQAAVFLENHHLYEDLQDLLMGMLHALTASIDAKDPYTCGHSRRVALLSKKLAEMCGFYEERVRRVYLAGLLHDIGKIGMPESVLLKAGRLTDEEYADVKKHPEVGARILGGIPQMADLIPAILHHHERLDGHGYPQGMAGSDIPIEALIVGLADSFDAMTSSRTYRASMLLEAVVTEIRRCSGTQFDSHLVELLLSLDLESYLGELRQAAAADAESPLLGDK